MASTRDDDRAEEPTSKTGVASLERALSILACFRKGDRGVSLTEIAKRTGFYKSTILRLCASLERFGYLVRLPNGRFTLGGAVFRLGQIYQTSFDIGDFVLPVLHRLSSGTQHSASLWIMEGDFRVCLYRVEAAGSVRDATAQVGERWPLNRGGSASTILRAFSGARGERFDRARRAGVAVSLGEFVPELAAISCPVFSLDDSLLGVLSLGGFRSQFTNKTIAKLKPQVLDAAREITVSLGGTHQRRKDAPRPRRGVRAAAAS
jgi:DNA-binding IclR family transcriptional regulator